MLLKVIGELFLAVISLRASFHRAQVIFIESVPALMIFQVASIFERALAKSALVRALTGMRSNVNV